MPIFFILSIVSIVSRCVIFKKHDIKWWKGLIPVYNIYTIGKICDSKKLGIANAISQTVLFIVFFLCFGFEIYLISEYAMNVDDQTFDQAYVVVVPENIANIAIVSKYILVGIAAITFGFWCLMMWQFIKVHKKSAWWILLWAIIPPIAYAAFALSNDVYINGQLYTSERVISSTVVEHKKKKVRRK